MSLPSDVRHAPEVATLVAPDEAPFLTDGSLMLRPEEERSEMSQSLIVPYVDPKLRSSRRLHTDFVRQLLDIGLFRVTRVRRGTVGLFFVLKKMGRSASF